MRVPGIGPLDAKIAIVGEAPGADEERLGAPFVGASGHMLDEMLRAVGLDRRQCYLTNVAKERPPGNDFRTRYYSDSRGLQATPALEALRAAVREELARRSPPPCVVVALGEEALRALTGQAGIGDWRGSILDGGYYKVVPTYHPAAVLRKYEWRRIVEHDLRRAKEESTTRTLTLPRREAIVDATYEGTLLYLDAVMRSGRLGQPVSFDIETLGPRVRCIALSADPGEAICIPFMSCHPVPALFPSERLMILPPSDSPFGSHWPEDQERELLRRLDLILGDPSIPLVAQNFPFDAGMLEREFGIVCRGLWMDTMVAQHCCYSELPKGLDFLCSFYTRTPCYWRYDASSDHQTWIYNCYDAMVTLSVARALENEMRELGV